MKLKIKVGDEVQILAGKEKGQKSLVLDLDSNKLKVRVKDVRIQTLFSKKDGMGKREGFIDYSNVKLIKKAELKKDFKSKKTGLFAAKPKKDK